MTNFHSIQKPPLKSTTIIFKFSRQKKSYRHKKQSTLVWSVTLVVGRELCLLWERYVDVKRKKEVKSEAQWCNERDEDDAMCLLSHYFTVGLFGSKSEFFLVFFFLDSINGFLTLERKDLKKFSSIQIRTLSIIKIITVFCTKLPPPGFLCEILYHDFTSLTQLPCRQKSQWYLYIIGQLMNVLSYPVNTIQL